MPFGALIVFLLFPIAVSAQTLDTSALDAHQFTIGRVGFVGQHTAAERAMQHIASLPDAADIFQAVIDDRHRSNVAKLYALCGLKQVQGPGFPAAAHQLASLPAQVSVMHGDVMEKESARQMVQRIRQHLCGITASQRTSTSVRSVFADRDASKQRLSPSPAAPR